MKISFAMFLQVLWKCFLRTLFGSRTHHHRPKISLLIPFSTNDPVRLRNFKWLLRYWKHELPDAEIVVGRSHSPVFCKGEALNDAALRSTGRVLVVLDADAYMEGYQLESCANRILLSLERGQRLWFVPYRHLYRLKEWVSRDILASNPRHPLRIPNPPPHAYYENHGDKMKYGHRYGAMCIMFPREAYEIIGCFPEEFVGWGGEDIALLRLLDTVYAKHKTFHGPIYHIWHPNIGEDFKTRRWEGQEAGNANSNLANKYHKAHRKPSEMMELIKRALAHRHSKKK